VTVFRPRVQFRPNGADTWSVQRWTRAQVEQFAPDDRSVAAARKLARPGPWSDTGATDTLVWGKCQGSGKTPYQVSVDLTGPAAKCTCPSRKFPCKHGIALLMMWVDGNGTVAEAGKAADFAADWADGRAAKARKREAAAASPSEPADPEAAARRLERRLGLMTAGAEDFEVWLHDLYRTGFAAARRQPYAFWEAPAARLLDAQLPGLAARVRDMPALLHRDDWADRLLAETGRWYTAVRAWQRRDDLDPSDLANLRVYLGWAVPSSEVRSEPTIDDTWTVRGLHRTDDGRLQSQRTWIHGEQSGTDAVLLDFAVAGAFLEAGHVVGSSVRGPVALYPGAGVRRALFTQDPVPAGPATSLGAATSIATAADRVARELAANPFADQHPVTLGVRLVVEADDVVAVDDEGAALDLAEDYEPWNLLAVCGYHPVALFGELESGRFRPLAACLDDGLVPV